MSTLCNLSYWNKLNTILLSCNCIDLIAKVYNFYRDREIRRSCIAAFANLAQNASELNTSLIGNRMMQILVNCLTAFDSEELKNISAFALCNLIKKRGFLWCLNENNVNSASAKAGVFFDSKSIVFSVSNAFSCLGICAANCRLVV